MPLAAGRLRSRITVMRPLLTSDGHGEQDRSWEEVATVWAEAISQNGREALIAGALQGISAMRFTIRHRRDVDASCQVRYGEREFNIRSAEDPDGRREQLVIFADTESALPSAA